MVKSEIKELGEKKISINIEAPVEMLKAAMESNFSKYQSRVQEPGFRKGKVPAEIIRRKFAKSIEAEAVNDVIEQSFEEVIREKNISPYAAPLIDNLTFTPDGPVKYDAIVELKPEVELGNYKGIKLDNQAVSVTDEEVDGSVKYYTEAYTTLKPVEGRTSQKGDFVEFYYSLTVDGSVLKGMENRNMLVELGNERNLPEFENALYNISAGAEKDIEVTLPDNFYLKQHVGQKGLYKIKVFAVKEKQVPEFNDEFVRNIQGGTTKEEFLDKIRKSIIETKSEEAGHAVEHKLTDAIIANSKVLLPPSLVDRQVELQYEDLNENLKKRSIPFDTYLEGIKKSKEELDAEMRKDAVMVLSEYLLVNEIGRKENIRLEEKDIDDYVSNLRLKPGVKREKVKQTLTDHDKSVILRRKIFRYLLSVSDIQTV